MKQLKEILGDRYTISYGRFLGSLVLKSSAKPRKFFDIGAEMVFALDKLTTKSILLNRIETLKAISIGKKTAFFYPIIDIPRYYPNSDNDMIISRPKDNTYIIQLSPKSLNTNTENELTQTEYFYLLDKIKLELNSIK